MPDAELFKLLLQGGMFGLWLIVVVWVLFRGAPMVKESLAHSATEHASAFKSVADSHKEAVRVISEAHTESAQVLGVAIRESIQTLQAECREERREMEARFAKERADARAAEREFRHDLASKFQTVLNGMATAGLLAKKAAEDKEQR